MSLIYNFAFWKAYMHFTMSKCKGACRMVSQQYNKKWAWELLLKRSDCYAMKYIEKNIRRLETNYTYFLKKGLNKLYYFYEIGVITFVFQFTKKVKKRLEKDKKKSIMIALMWGRCRGKLPQ